MIPISISMMDAECWTTDDGQEASIVHHLRSIVRELYSKTATQAEFEAIHLAFVGLVVVPAQVKKAMQN